MLSAKDFLLLALAVGWLLFVFFLGYVLIRLGKVLRSTETLVVGVTDRTVPLLSEVTTSVVQVNGQLERIDTITTHAATVSSNVAALVSLFGATLGGPLIKVAAFSYGVRKAAGRKQRADIEREVKATIKADKKSAKATKRAKR